MKVTKNRRKASLQGEAFQFIFQVYAPKEQIGNLHEEEMRHEHPPQMEAFL